jgi:uncharacterized membrane protein
MANRSLLDYSLLILKGVAMGIANKIPGVSGGIVAVVTGFYEELIFSFQRLNFKAVSLLFRGRFRTFWQYVNGRFLTALFVGVVLSYFTLSLLLDAALTFYPLNVWALFFGLVLASAIILHRDFSKWNKKNLLLGIIGLAVGVGLSVLSPSTENTNLLYVFLCGYLSIIGMTLPGLSGSFLLILMGNYSLLLVDSVNALSRYVISTFSNIEQLPEDANYSIIFAVFLFGCLIGISSLSALIHKIQQRAKDELQAVLIGFVFGSLFILWPPNRIANFAEINNIIDTIWAVIWGAVGLIIVFVLDYYERKK